MDRLECAFCGRRYPFDVFRTFCPLCQEPLVITSSPRRRVFCLERSLAIERYQPFLPLAKIDKNLSLGEGATPLVPLERVRRKHGFPMVYAKNEAVNPTHSFKDRGTAVAVQKAVALGIKSIGTVSTGNMAGSTAAYGAKAGLKTVILLKEDVSAEKALAAGVYGPFLVRVKGDYGRLFEASLEIGRKQGIYFMNSVDPLRIEGYKVTGYEIYGQLGKHVPRYLLVPVSSAGHLIGLLRAFIDLKQEHITADLPVFVGVQARGCSPLARAFSQGKDRYSRVNRPVTIAHAISNPAPPGGNLALKMLRESGGMIISVTDNEIMAAQRELARLEGIFVDPASATVLAGLIRLSEKKKLNVREDVVLVITGSGLKTMECLDRKDIPVRLTTLPRLEKVLESLSA